MAPIEGLVLKSSGSFMKVRLCSGKVLHIPKVKKLAFGDKAWICFNYTDMSVREVLTDYEYHELDKDTEVELGPEFDPETGIVEGIALNGSVFLSD
ncbi:MAG: hypothetical protein E3J23_01950 [Candidatus Stahlbacteria bacterium]|nr:MAG: hypothetical protein E3J23_01950 [Candidatus Stahlbacteria bacterium]